MSIFTSQKVWNFFYKKSADKFWSKKDKEIKVSTPVQNRVKSSFVSIMTQTFPEPLDSSCTVHTADAYKTLYYFRAVVDAYITNYCLLLFLIHRLQTFTFLPKSSFKNLVKKSAFWNMDHLKNKLIIPRVPNSSLNLLPRRMGKMRNPFFNSLRFRDIGNLIFSYPHIALKSSF